MIYPMVPFPVTLSDPWSRSQGHGVSIDALDVLCAQLTRDLFAIAKFLYAFASTAKKSCPCISTRATSVSGLTCWNSLLLQLKSASLTLQQFCDRLKTVLFSRTVTTPFFYAKYLTNKVMTVMTLLVGRTDISRCCDWFPAVSQSIETIASCNSTELHVTMNTRNIVGACLHGRSSSSNWKSTARPPTTLIYADCIF